MCCVVTKVTGASAVTVSSIADSAANLGWVKADSVANTGGPLTIGTAVVAAIIGIFAIGLGAWFLSTRADQSPPSSRETVSHKAEH